MPLGSKAWLSFLARPSVRQTCFLPPPRREHLLFERGVDGLLPARGAALLHDEARPLRDELRERVVAPRPRLVGAVHEGVERGVVPRGRRARDAEQEGEAG